MSNMFVYMVSIHVHPWDMHIRTPHMKCVVDIINKFTKGTPYIRLEIIALYTYPVLYYDKRVGYYLIYWKQRYSIEYYYGFLVIAINYDNLDNNLNNDINNNN